MTIQTITEAEALATWSGISEPGDTRAGALVADLGPVAALEWVAAPFDHSDATPCEAAHTKLHTRLSHFDLDQELAALKSLGGTLITRVSQDWPNALKALGNAEPYALWMLGQLPDPSAPSVTLVGSRASTTYGNAVATAIAGDLATAGVTVVSGGAYGIDAAAHRGALNAQLRGDAAPTVAVLSGGLANAYPAGNREMFSHIVEANGAILTEMPPSFKPARWRFLERNRLLAALSQATIVVEAGMRSGAVAAAHRADELDRPVGAVPGPITSATSSGSNQLLKDGATVITDAQDITALIGTEPALAESAIADGELDTVDPLELRDWHSPATVGAAS